MDEIWGKEEDYGCLIDDFQYCM